MNAGLERMRHISPYISIISHIYIFVCDITASWFLSHMIIAYRFSVQIIFDIQWGNLFPSKKYVIYICCSRTLITLIFNHRTFRIRLFTAKIHFFTFHYLICFTLDIVLILIVWIFQSEYRTALICVATKQFLGENALGMPIPSRIRISP